METKPFLDTICMSGGGIMGLSFLGAIECLENNLYIDINKINNWVGTSAGSILSFLLTLGYTVQELKEFIFKFNFDKINPEPSIDNLILKFGIDDGSKIVLVLTEFLKEKHNITDITFKDHYILTNKKLTIIGTNITKGSEILFNYEITPTMSVITAIRISSSIPFIFTPVLYESEYYIDGAFVNNFPIKYCNPKTTLGIYININYSYEHTNILNFINRCIQIISYTISEKDTSELFPYIIKINNKIRNFVEFNIDNDGKTQIINLGKSFAEKYLENNQSTQTQDQSTQTQDQSTQTQDQSTQTQDQSTQTLN